MVNLNRLHYFFICAQSKQVTRAAEILGISQPSLSQQLKVFEDELGFELFTRSSRALELTPKGKVLYEKSMELFRNAEEILNYVEEKVEDISSYLVLVSDQIDRPFVAEIIGKLFKQNRSMSRYFQVISKPHSEIVDHLGQNQFDLFITSEKLKKHQAFATFQLPVNLFTSKPHFEVQQFSEKNLKGMLAALGESLVLPSLDLHLRGEIDIFLAKEGIETDIIFESNIMACTVRAIKEGVGCGFLPLPFVAHDLKKNQLTVLGPPGGYWEYPLYIYLKDQHNSEDIIATKMSQILRSYY